MGPRNVRAIQLRVWSGLGRGGGAVGRGVLKPLIDADVLVSSPRTESPPPCHCRTP